MKYTNKKKLSPLMAGMIERSMLRYNPGDSDYSTTTLIDSPRVVALKRKHKDELEVDVSDLIAAFVGNAVHDYLEELAPEDCDVEERLFTEVDGVKISGCLDIITPNYYEFGKYKVSVGDYKTIKVWGFIFGEVFEKWEQQLNINAWLAKQNGYEVEDTGFIEYFLMDFQQGRADTDKSYPQSQQGRWEVKLWSEEKQLEFIKERIKLHEQTKKELPLCSEKDQWKKDGTYKLMKKGRKTSLKNEADLLKLVEWGMNKGVIDDDEQPIGPHYFDYIEGEYTRCKKYCNVNKWCTQWKNIKGD